MPELPFLLLMCAWVEFMASNSSTNKSPPPSERGRSDIRPPSGRKLYSPPPSKRGRIKVGDSIRSMRDSTITKPPSQPSPFWEGEGDNARGNHHPREAAFTSPPPRKKGEAGLAPALCEAAFTSPPPRKKGGAGLAPALWEAAFTSPPPRKKGEG